MGRIIRWRDTQMFPGGAFIWSRLLLAGDQANEREHAKGNIKGDIFGCPDSLSIGPGDLLWIQTNVHSSQLNQGEFKRFLTGPNMREITGVLFTPDGTTLFNIVQHPGESPTDRGDPKYPDQYSSWPDHIDDNHPRSATVAIRKINYGVIGG